MDRYIRIGIIGGAIWSIAGLALLFSKNISASISAPVFEAGVIVLSISLVYWFLWRFRKDSFICDERAMHIVIYSLAYSWFITLAGAVVFIWAYRLHWLALTIPMVFGIWILTMTISGFLSYLILAKRGTVE